MCELVTWAPNHKKTWPWRFALFTDHGRARLGDDDGRRHGRGRFGDEGKRLKTRTKYLRTPAVLVVGATPHDNSMLDLENRDAVAAGVQNLLLGATTIGLASFWSTPALTSPPRVLELCGFDADRPHRRDDLPRLGERTGAGAGTADGRDQPHRRLSDRPDGFGAHPFLFERGRFSETEPVSDTRPTMITLDLEGVLVPEIWIAVAERTGHRRTAPHHPRRARLRRR